MSARLIAVVLAIAVSLVPCMSRAALQDCDVSATSVAFGAYDPLNASASDSVGTISMTCSVTLVALLVSWDIRLSAGGSGSFSNRYMTSGSRQLNYNLYLDASHSTIWGDGAGQTSYVSENALIAIGTSTHQYSVYGRVPAGQDRGAGAYTDTIVVTLNY